MTFSPLLLELMASRICHDLVSPVGAIQNGIEFAKEMGMDDGAEEAFGLIGHSAKTAAARLQVFRLVYGQGGKDASIKPEDVHAAFDKLLSVDSKVTQNWDPHADLGLNDGPDGFCKVLTATLMLAQECLPKGGAITVTSGDNENTIVTASGERVKIRDYVDECLQLLLPVGDLDARLVHPYVSAVLAKECGYQIALHDEQDTHVSFEISLA